MVPVRVHRQYTRQITHIVKPHGATCVDATTHRDQLRFGLDVLVGTVLGLMRRDLGAFGRRVDIGQR